MLRDMGTPGQLIQWLSIMEDLKVDGQTAYWNYAGNFNDNSARANAANAGWWMYKWYGDLAGSQTVAVTPPALNTVDTLQGIGAIDARNKRATVLYGGGSKPVSLKLPASTAGSSASGSTSRSARSPSPAPRASPVRRRSSRCCDGVPWAAARSSLDVPTYDRYAAYQVLITPSRTGSWWPTRCGRPASRPSRPR
jgi:hypothetical protein